MDDLGKAIMTVIIIVVLNVFIMTDVGSCMIFKKNAITTKRRIEPELRITSDGKKFDTIYVYKKL